MTKDKKPNCTICGKDLTIKHIFTEDISKFNIPNTLDETPGPNTDTNNQILLFLKKLNVYNLI